MQAVWIQIRTDRKKLVLKKASRRQQKHKKIPSMQRVEEGFDARAISVIRRRPLKCSGDTAQLVRISCAFLGHSCNKYFILMGRFVTDVTSEDSNESDHPRILISAYNACAHNIYTPTFRTEAYWIVASACWKWLHKFAYAINTLCSSSTYSCKTAQMRRLVWVNTGYTCDKY